MKKKLSDLSKPDRGKDERELTSGVSFSCPNPEWTQVGMDIDGVGVKWLGRKVALSADGLVMIAGAPNQGKGTARVYKVNETDPLGWSQIGQDLIGEAENDYFGSSVAVSDYGDIIAVGGKNNDDAGSQSGHVRVFQRDTSTSLGWSQIGQDIEGESPLDNFGDSVALSGSGDVLAVGAGDNSGNAIASGHVRVYERASSPSDPLGWRQVGGDLDGDAIFNYMGRSGLALSNSGDIVAIGAHGWANYRGHVRVFRRDPALDLGWVQVGGDIEGESQDDESGWSVSLSDSGEVLAIGVIYGDGNGRDSGHVRVYRRDTSSTLGWTQIGGDIDGEAAGDYFGYSVSLSGNGDIIAISGIRNDESARDSGHVRVYSRDPESILGWVQVGDDMDGEGICDDFGYSVSLSRNGEVLAVGSPYNTNDSIYSGHVRVFQACNESFNPPPPPCDGNQDKFEFQILTDNSGEQITWKVQIKESGDFEDYFGRGVSYGNQYGDNTGLQESYCFPKRGKCHRFVILDSSGDGLCCSNGRGGYRVKFKGITLKESRFKDKEYEIVTFGDC